MGHTCGKTDASAFFKIGYGLYIVTSKNDEVDNGMICNTVIQVKSNPAALAVTINKGSYTHDIAKETGTLNVHVLSVDTPFEVFENFGFHSGRDYNKFEKYPAIRCENDLPLLMYRFVNAVFQLKCTQYVDLDTHGMFICDVEGAAVFSQADTMSYDYYHKNVKPQKEEKGEEKPKGYVCTICGYVHEGEELPPDIICPICRHGAEAFEKIK